MFWVAESSMFVATIAFAWGILVWQIVGLGFLSLDDWRPCPYLPYFSSLRLNDSVILALGSLLLKNVLPLAAGESACLIGDTA